MIYWLAFMEGYLAKRERFMNNIIHIKFSENLPTKKQNELRYRMELARWKEDWRIAESMGDHLRMDELNHNFQYIGLP